MVTTAGNVARILRVGNNATGTLTISGGTLNHTGASFVGAFAGSTGVVNVTGPGSAWNWTTASVLQIGALGTGTVNVSNGGVVSNPVGTLTMGGPTGVGTLKIQDSGSVVRVNAFQIGQTGKASLDVSNGGTMISGASIIGQGISSLTSTASIDGAGSSWTAAALTIGSVSAGELSITNGGVVGSGNAIIGNSTSAIAVSRVTVEGAGSQWTLGSLSIGARSNAEMLITDDAKVSSSGGVISGSTSTGFVQLEGNSVWDTSNLTGNATLTVGASNFGTLNILSGSSAQTSNRLIIGTGPNGVGNMLVDNSSFTLLPQSIGVQANTTEVGRDVGTGTLIVQNGSTVVLNDSTLQMGTRNIGAEGTLIVRGAGTSITAIDGGFSVGQNGTGHFQLLDGAVANTGDFLSAGNASAIAGASDSVVDNATWNIVGSGANAPMRLGSNGTATLDLQNGAVVNVADGGAGARMEISTNPGSSGTLTIGGTGATLNVTEIVGGKRDIANGGAIVQGGTATVTFNHTNTALIFAPALLGYLSLNQTNSGTTILTGDSDFTGITTISAGTLQLGNGGTTGSITSDVLNGARLVFNRSNELAIAGAISGTGTVDQNGSGVTILSGTNTYGGATGVNAGTLQAGALNTFSPNSTFTVASAATLNLASFNQTVAGLNNAGLVTLSSAGNVGTTLTTSTYHGANGKMALNVYLDSDGSSSDRLIISGGAAAGTTSLLVNNVGGPGNLTFHDGIMVVQALNGATTSVGAFTLSGRAIAGAYEYLLFQGGQAATGGNPNDQNWYLRNTLSTPDEPIVPNIRPEVAVAIAVPPLAVEYGYAMIDTLNERVGEIFPGTARQKQGTGQPQWFAGAWGRLIGERGQRNRNNFLHHGSDYNYTISGIQAGLDLWGRERDGDLDKAGLYVGFGRISSDVNGEFDLKAGSVDMDGYTLGGYWTHRAASGWYTDAVVQGTFYDTETRSIKGEKISPNGWGLAASLESGYAFRLGNNWTIEPQVQLAYQRVSIDRDRDVAAIFSYQDWNSLRGRLGVRVAKTWNTGSEQTPRIITSWVRANIWHEFLGGDAMTVSSLSGENPVRFSSPLKGTWGELGVGVSGQVSNNMTMFATAAYNRSLDNKGRDGWSGRLGATVNW